jgi:hypothetical protein
LPVLVFHLTGKHGTVKDLTALEQFEEIDGKINASHRYILQIKAAKRQLFHTQQRKRNI